MCSIGGFISEKPITGHLAQRVCEALLFYGQDRGKQSSGIYINGVLLKKAETATTFIQRDDFEALFTEPASMALVHNRFPTSGGTGDEQAHPFQCNDSIVVHNGGIQNATEVKQQFSLEKSSGVDSELFAAAIGQLGLNRLTEVTAAMSGSAAIAFIHEGVLHLARDKGPLEYMVVKTGDNHVLIFGSLEEQVLRAVRYNWLIAHYRTITLPSQVILPINAQGPEPSIGAFITKSYTSSSYNYDQDDDCCSWSAFRHRALAPELPLQLPIKVETSSPLTVSLPSELGWGWQREWDAGRQVWKSTYSAEYAEAQRAKFPGLVLVKGGGSRAPTQGKRKNRNRNGSFTRHPLH